MRTVAVIAILLVIPFFSTPGVMAQPIPNPVDAQRQVTDTERAFAQSMLDRDHAAFASFLSEEAVFFSDPQILRGKVQVANAWQRFYEGPTAPFSWQPELVEVLPSGNLAISSGPVRNTQGKLIATYTSIWRLEAPGVWRIVFDKGNETCNCGSP